MLLGAPIIRENCSSALAVVRQIRQRFRSEALEEHRRNFAPSCRDSKKRKAGLTREVSAKCGKCCQWTAKYFCLASKDATHVPTTVAAKVELVEADLGEKKVEVPDVECTTQEFHSILITAFPRLRDGGGFELLRCVANTRLLEAISPSVARSPKVLRRVVGNSRIYIRPIQKDLDVTPVDEPSTSQEVSCTLS